MLKREILLTDCVLKNNPWTYKTKDLNRKPKLGAGP